MKKTRTTADRDEAHLSSIVLDTEKHGDALIALIRQGGYVPLRITGSSMSPFLRPNRDTVWLKAYDPEKTKIGQILFFRRPDGAFVLHRVRKCLPDGTLKMNGDAQSWCEIIPRDSVIAAAEEVSVCGKRMSCRAFPIRVWNFLWYPTRAFRPALFRLYAFIKNCFPKH